MKLNALQTLLHDALYYGEDDDELLSKISPSQKISPKEQIKIYRHNMSSGFNQSLAQIYPVCKKLVGDEFFSALTRQYISSKPANSPEAENYSQDFAEFIEKFAPIDAAPYLVDIAKLEWASAYALNCEDAQPLNNNALKRVSVGTVTFHLPKSATLLSSPYPIRHIWEINQDSLEHEKDFLPSKTADLLFIYRKSYALHIDKLSDSEWIFLNALNNMPFSKVCGTLTRHVPNINIVNLLPRAIKNGWIESFTSSLQENQYENIA